MQPAASLRQEMGPLRSCANDRSPGEPACTNRLFSCNNLRVNKLTPQPRLLTQTHLLGGFLALGLFVGFAPPTLTLCGSTRIAWTDETSTGRDSERGDASGVVQSLQHALEDALTKRQSEKVRDVLDELLRQAHLESDVLLQIGISLAQQDYYAEAVKVFDRCSKDYPRLFEAHYNLALAELALGRFSEALSAIEQASSAGRRQEVARLYLRGKIEESMGRDEKAEQDLSAAFADAPQEENYALDLGLFYLRQRRYQKSMEVFKKATFYHSNSSFLWLGLALAQYLGGHAGDSSETCRIVLQLEPDFSPARVLLAFALYMDGKLAEAEKIASTGVNGADVFPYLYYVHAVTLLRLQSKDYPRILSELRAAAQSIPGCSLCCLAESKVHQAMGQLGAGVADLEKAIAMDPTFAEAWYRLASLLDQQGRHEDAQRARTRFEELKEQKSKRETEMIRKGFLEALGGGRTSEHPH